MDVKNINFPLLTAMTHSREKCMSQNKVAGCELEEIEGEPGHMTR